jgi:hypothetical protein
MRIATLSLLALMTLPAMASIQEPWQVGLALNQSPSSDGTWNQGNASTWIKRKAGLGFSVNAGYSVLDLDHSDLSVTAEYQLQTKYNGQGSSTSPSLPTSASGTFKSQYFAPGVQWNFHKAVDFGLGLQYRLETLKGNLEGTASTSYNRPWLNAYVGYTIPTNNLAKPFVALRVARALDHTTSPAANAAAAPADSKRLLRYLAPSWQTSLQVGVRF